MGIKNGTDAYNMIYGDNPLFVKTINQKNITSSNTVELIDLPTINMTALMGFTKNCTLSHKNIGQLVLFRDILTGSILGTLRDNNFVISEDNYPLKSTDECVIPSKTLNREDEEFYENSYFKLASQIQKLEPKSFITILPISCPSEREIETFNRLGKFDEKENRLSTEIFHQIYSGMFNHHITDEKRSTKKQPMFITHDEIAAFGRGEKWNLKYMQLLTRFEGIVMFIAQDIIRRILELLPEMDTIKYKRIIILTTDGICHPIKEKERDFRKENRRKNTNGLLDMNSQINNIRQFLFNIPACILNHYLLNVLRIPLVCRLGARNLYYSKADYSEAETEIVHMASYLCNLNMPHTHALNNKKLKSLEIKFASMTSQENSIIANRNKYCYITWNEFKEQIKCDDGYSINLYSSDNDVLHKWNMCANHSIAMRDNFLLPSHVVDVKFYRTMIKNISTTWMPNTNRPSTSRVQYQMCYDLTTTHIPHDNDAGLLLMVLFGSDYNDPAMSFSNSLNMTYREILNFKRVACTCHRGWKKYITFVKDKIPLYSIRNENVLTCDYCHKIIIRQFWETKSFFASVVCLIMKELDPKMLIMDEPVDEKTSHLIIAINCVCNICAFLLLGRYNTDFYENLTECVILKRLCKEKQQIYKKNSLENIVDLHKITNSIIIGSYILNYYKDNCETYTDGGIRQIKDTNRYEIVNTNQYKKDYNNKKRKEIEAVTSNNNNCNFNNNEDTKIKRLKNCDIEHRIHNIDLDLGENGVKVLTMGSEKYTFWEFLYDATICDRKSLIYKDGSKDYNNTIDISDCLEKYSFSIKNTNVIKNLTNLCIDNNKNIFLKERDTPSAINRFIDLLLSIYLYIIGENISSKMYRKPIEHCIYNNNTTRSTIKDMILETLVVMYGEKLVGEIKENNNIYEEINKICQRYIRTNKLFISKLKHNNTDNNCLKESEMCDNVHSNIYIPILGEARLYTPLILWTIYISRNNINLL
nr:MAG: wsv139-like protein [Metapenaeopsis lamellata majanivirus]